MEKFGQMFVYNRRKAITYVEIMIACILMVVVFFIGNAISNGFDGAKKVRNYETAIALANQAIEAVRAARSNELGSNKSVGLKEKISNHGSLIGDFMSPNNKYDKNLDGFIPEIEINGIKYKRTVSIENVASTNKYIETGLKVIKVLVEWKAAEDGKPVAFEVVTAHCDLW